MLCTFLPTDAASANVLCIGWLLGGISSVLSACNACNACMSPSSMSSEYTLGSVLMHAMRYVSHWNPLLATNKIYRHEKYKKTTFFALYAFDNCIIIHDDDNDVCCTCCCYSTQRKAHSAFSSFIYEMNIKCISYMPTNGDKCFSNIDKTVCGYALLCCLNACN